MKKPPGRVNLHTFGERINESEPPHKRRGLERGGRVRNRHKRVLETGSKEAEGTSNMNTSNVILLLLDRSAYK